MKTIIGLDQLLAHIDADDAGPALIAGLDRPDVDTFDATRIPPGSVVVGSSLGSAFAQRLVEAGSALFTAPTAPFEPARASLYNADELFDGFDPEHPCTYCDTTDAKIYRHFVQSGGTSPSPAEALLRRVHDHQITEHLRRWLDNRRVVAIMGGHDMARSSDDYRDVVVLARQLARDHFTIATGGGPGAMEAGHLGAYLANHDDSALDQAIGLLDNAPDYRHEEWLAAAFRTRAHLDAQGPKPVESIGVPTWTYGHEPPNIFATTIAKYFENSVREDGLVSIANHGIVFTPGNAGTVQEVFQDATQNHYATINGAASAMVFLGRDYWTNTRPVIGLLRTLSTGRPYDDLICMADGPDEAAAFIRDNPPIQLPVNAWSYCSEFCS